MCSDERTAHAKQIKGKCTHSRAYLPSSAIRDKDIFPSRAYTSCQSVIQSNAVNIGQAFDSVLSACGLRTRSKCGGGDCRPELVCCFFFATHKTAVLRFCYVTAALR